MITQQCIHTFENAIYKSPKYVVNSNLICSHVATCNLTQKHAPGSITNTRASFIENGPFSFTAMTQHIDTRCQKQHWFKLAQTNTIPIRHSIFEFLYIYGESKVIFRKLQSTFSRNQKFKIGRLVSNTAQLVIRGWCPYWQTNFLQYPTETERRVFRFVVVFFLRGHNFF